VFDVRSRRKTFFMSAHNTQQREVKKEKKITLNSRISPPGKRYDYLLLFRPVFCKRRNVSLVFLSYSQRRSLSHPNTHHRHPISLSLFLSLFYYTNICISENNATTRPNPLLTRARIHVARELFYVCKRERGTQHKIGSQTQKIEREKRKKSLLSSLS